MTDLRRHRIACRIYWSTTSSFDGNYSSKLVDPKVIKIPSDEIIKRMKNGTLFCSICGRKLGVDTWIKIESDGVSSIISCFDCVPSGELEESIGKRSRSK